MLCCLVTGRLAAMCCCLLSALLGRTVKISAAVSFLASVLSPDRVSTDSHRRHNQYRLMDR